MTDFADGKILAFVGPQELGAPDNLETVIVDFIRGAKESLDIAVQELDSEAIAQAILDKSWEGISVRMFLEQDYLFSPLPPKKERATDPEIYRSLQVTGTSTSNGLNVNRDILAKLLRNGVDVKADYNPEIFHQKFIIRDFRTDGRRRKPGATAAILTGSANFTETDTHRNLNNVIIFYNNEICAEYEVEFDEIRSGTFGELNSRHRAKPRTININGVPVRILFAPDHAPELEIVKQMLKCEKRLDFAIFTFSGSSGIDDAMIMLREANRKLQGALDPTQGKQYWAATDWLHGKGIKVYLPKKEGDFKTFRKLHHKLMVIDEAIVIAGSMNYTAPANEYNDENIFVIGSPYAHMPKSDGGPVDVAECAKIANFFRAEIDRIIANSALYAPKPPPAPEG